MKLITVLKGESRVTSKITDLKNLNLPQVWEKRIEKIIYDHRMLYEPWIESAENFEEIRSRMIGRGYSNVPMGAGVLLDLAAYAKAPTADTSSCRVTRTMIRKKNS